MSPEDEQAQWMCEAIVLDATADGRLDRIIARLAESCESITRAGKRATVVPFTTDEIDLVLATITAGRACIMELHKPRN